MMFANRAHKSKNVEFFELKLVSWRIVTVMKKQQGRCIFCGGYGLSKEHVFPDWLTQVVPKDKVEHTQNLTNVRFNHPGQGQALVNSRIRSEQGDFYSRKVRKFCKTCNERWMSNLQSRAKSSLTQLIQGYAPILNCEDQDAIASWIGMTTIVAEYTDPTTLGITSAQRELFYENLNISGSQIWISRYAGTDWNKRYKHHGLQFRSRFKHPQQLRPSDLNLAQTTTFVIGAFFAHVCSASSDSIRYSLPSHLQEKLIPLKTKNVSEILWPSLAVIDDNLADEIADAPLGRFHDGFWTIPF